MQRIGDEYTVLDDRGNGVPSATVTVYPAGVSTPLPSVYEATGSAAAPNPKANPMTTDALGRWQCALPDGRYDFTFSGGTFPTYTMPNICVYDSVLSAASPALGTVTSVGLTLPAITFSTGAAVTSSGTLTGTYLTQVKNKFLSGPGTGADATPTWRVQVLADLPNFGPTASTTFGSATQVAQVTTNAQGIITTIANVTVTPTWANVTSKPTTVVGRAMTDQVACVFRQTASVTVGNTTNETSLVSTGAGSATLTANQLIAGSTVRVKFWGYGSGVAAVTMTVKLKIGANTVIDIADAITTWTATRTFHGEAVCTVRTTGAGGTGFGQLVFQYESGATVVDLEDTTTSTGTVDTTASNLVDLTVQWGAAAAGNTMTCTNLMIYLEG